MDIQSILAELKKEREKLDRAIGALLGLGNQTRRRGRPAGSQQAAAPKRKRRHMSAASRKRISEMMKQRWAERKRKAR
jgi:hypothetical protein